MPANHKTTTGRNAERIRNTLAAKGYDARLTDGGAVVVADDDLPLPSWATEDAARHGLVQDRAASITDGVALRPREEVQR